MFSSSSLCNSWSCKSCQIEPFSGNLRCVGQIFSEYIGAPGTDAAVIFQNVTHPDEYYCAVCWIPNSKLIFVDSRDMSTLFSCSSSECVTTPRRSASSFRWITPSEAALFVTIGGTPSPLQTATGSATQPSVSCVSLRSVIIAVTSSVMCFNCCVCKCYRHLWITLSFYDKIILTRSALKSKFSFVFKLIYLVFTSYFCKTLKTQSGVKLFSHHISWNLRWVNCGFFQQNKTFVLKVLESNLVTEFTIQCGLKRQPLWIFCPQTLTFSFVNPG